jgi:hypothetical protein
MHLQEWAWRCQLRAMIFAAQLSKCEQPAPIRMLIRMYAEIQLLTLCSALFMSLVVANYAILCPPLLYSHRLRERDRLWALARRDHAKAHAVYRLL